MFLRLPKILRTLRRRISKRLIEMLRCNIIHFFMYICIDNYITNYTNCFYYFINAIASISTLTSFGSLAACTADLAGWFSTKYLA